MTMTRNGHDMQANTPRSAMTLVEVMVALMIFTVVGGAMVTILLLATDIYRRGEFSRGANDEAITVLGALNQDIDHLIPPSAGGWFFAKKIDEAGGCLVAFTISLDTSIRLNDTFTGVEQTNRVVNANATNQTAMQAGNISSRQIVAWWVDDRDRNRPLYRDTLPWDPQVSDPDTIYDKVRNLSGSGSLGTNANNQETKVVVTYGCLHFGTWLSFDSSDPTNYPRRRDLTRWEDGDTPLPPTTSRPYDSAARNDNDPPPPAPTALRISLALTGGTVDGGGKYAPQGRVIDDDGRNKLRVTGIKGLPLAEGANYLRIEQEWLRYDAALGVNIQCTERGARRSNKGMHGRGALVETGIQHAIVRSIGR